MISIWGGRVVRRDCIDILGIVVRLFWGGRGRDQGMKIMLVISSNCSNRWRGIRWISSNCISISRLLVSFRIW
jgi:hypothetical protein